MLRTRVGCLEGRLAPLGHEASQLNGHKLEANSSVYWTMNGGG